MKQIEDLDSEASVPADTIIHWNSHFYPIIGGIPSHITAICENVRSFRHVIVTSRVQGTKARDFLPPRSEVRRFRPVDWVRSGSPGLGWKPRLIIAASADVVRAARQRKHFRESAPALLNVHDIDWNLMHLHDLTGIATCGGIGQKLFAPQAEIPSVLTKHFMFVPKFSSANLRHWERTLTLSYPTIICVDRAIEEAVRNWADRAGSDNIIRYIPNSVDTAVFRPSPAPPFDRLRLGLVARLDAIRGEHFVTQVLSRLPDFVEFYGAIASDADRFREFASRFRSDQVHLERNLPRSEIPNFMSRIHLLFNPVEVEYGVGLASLEAMACGRPALMPNGASRYPLIPGKTGFVCPNDVDEMVRLLRQLYRNPDQVLDAGRQARRLIEREFAHSRIMPMWEQFYRNSAHFGR